jgi:hypothetical protein
MATQIKTVEEVQQLCAELSSKKRKRPACVISTPNGTVEPAFDVDDIDSEVSSVCDVFLIAGGDLTREMALNLPAETHVYGGAARVYPVGFSAAQPDFAGKTRYVFPEGALAKSTERLLSDIWAAASEAGLLAKASSTAKAVTGKVRQIYGEESVLVELGPQVFATIRQEATFPGVPLSWLFKVGQSVDGKYDSATRIFTLERPGATIEGLVAHFGLNSVTYGLVKATDRKKAVIALHPDVEFEVSKKEITGNPLDVVSEYLGVGDVVEVRIYKDAQGKIRLRMDDIDDTEVLFPALILVEGGEPWLAEDRALFEKIEDDFVDIEALSNDSGEVLSEVEFDAPAALSPTPAQLVAPAKLNSQERQHQAAVAHYLAEIKRGNRFLEAARSSNTTLKLALADAQEKHHNQTEELKQLRQVASIARKTKVSTARSGSTAFARLNRFADSEEWFREEIRRAWFKDFTPSDRRDYPLEDGNWAFGSKFLSGVTAKKLDDNELRKLFRAVLFLVTGRGAFDFNNESHALLENGKPMMIDGEPVKRMHIENGNPQAKRLHYLKKSGGAIELLQVSIHDNFGI